MSLDYSDPFIKENMFNGEFGIEIESLRVDEDGFIARTKHPFNDDPNIDRDFCESQVEFITNVCYSVDELYSEIERLHNTVVSKLKSLDSGQELLWPFSNPPYVKDEENIPIASYSGELKSKELYRQYLAQKYGKKKMLFSGIHFNFSFPEKLLEKGFSKSGYDSFKEYKNQVYLELAKKITEYSWLIVYLTAASPVMDGSYFKAEDLGQDVAPLYASPRCSEIGYWNDFVPQLNYESINKYIKSISSYIECDKLKCISELYYPVRLKPLGENSLESLEQNGINHIELRMLDLNPLSEVKIMKEDIEFLHIFILYLMSLENKEFSAQSQIKAIRNIKEAAKFDDTKIFIQSDNDSLPVKEAGLNILNGMESFFAHYSETNASEIIEYQKNKILNQQKRYAEIIQSKYGNSYVTKGLELAKTYVDEI